MNSNPFSLIKIPSDLDFDDLNLEVNLDSGALEFDWGPLRKIVKANAELTLDSDVAVVDLISAWYSGLRVKGYRHEVAERWLRSCEAVRAFGFHRVVAGPDTAH